MKDVIALFLFWILIFNCNSQSKHDSISLYNRLKSFSADITKDEIKEELKNIHLVPEEELANFYVALGNYQYVIFRGQEKASKNFYLALEQPIISDYTKADALNGIGTIYSSFYHHDLAIKNFKKSLTIIKNKHPDSIADINSLYNNIGHSFSNENLKDSASYYFKKGIDFGIKNNSPAMGCYFNMGYTHKNSDSAYYYTKKALDASILLKHEHLLTFCFLNLGANEISRGNYIKADSLLNLSEKKALKFKQVKYINEIKVQRARILIKEEKNKEAIAILNEVAPYFIKGNDFIQLESIYIWLERAYINNGDFKKAHTTLKKYHKNIFDKEKRKKLKKKEGVLFYKNIEKKLLIENNKNSTQKKFYSKIIISLLILFGTAIFLFFKQKQKQQKKNKKLRSTVGSLENENIQNHQKLLFKSLLVDENQSLLKQLANDLKAIQQNSSTKNKKELLNLYKKIQQNIKDNVINEFEFHFEKVHPNFYKSFSKNGFELSKNEMRLTALIKLNFNTKEISEITKQSSNTINVAKSRLKSKLNLNKDSSLYHFIQSIDFQQ